MRHYSLIPVRYNDQQLLVRCDPVDAELWSIQWSGDLVLTSLPPKPIYHWFADVSPLERDTGQAIVQWLNNREQFAVTLLDEHPRIPQFRSK